MLYNLLVGGRKELWVGIAVTVGFVLVAIGFGLGYLLAAGGLLRLAKTGDPTFLAYSGIGPILIAVGVLLIVGAIVYGIVYVRKRETSKVAYAYSGTVVLARYAMDPQGDMRFDPEPPEDSSYRLFLRLRLPDGTSDEYRVGPEVYVTAGEGMSGTAFIQGDWVGRFQPEMGPPR